MKQWVFGVLFVMIAVSGCGVGNQKKDQDPGSIFQHARVRAEKGDMAAQYLVGRMYREGVGVEKNTETGLSWLNRSAEQGYKDAQFLLGLIYDEGTDVIPDGSKAAVWYEKAAEQGDKYAQYNLSQLYLLGIGQAGLYKGAVQSGFHV